MTPLATRTRVVILQHPRERDVPINTARIASLCLPSAELHVGVDFGAAAFLHCDPRPAALLYPDEGAVDVERFPPPTPITLVVVDGTWSQAKKLVRTNPALAALPRFAFRPPAPSDYRIRREPKADYVSTIEALVHVLGVLEGDPARFRTMLAPFRAMVDAQLAFAARRTGPPRVLTRKRLRSAGEARTLPAMLREHARDLLCVYGEASAWPYGAPERATFADELVQWVAHRPATGETFDAILAPRRLAPSTPFHAELDPETIRRGVDARELVARWSAFVRETDVVCSWGHYAATLFHAAGGRLPEARIDLRRVARAHARASVGTMEDYRAKLGVEAASLGVRGRAGRRLAELGAIARALTAT